MKDYAKTKRIPLEAATKAEIVAAIKCQFKLEPTKDIEKSIYWIRIDNLLAKMRQVNLKIQDRGKSRTTLDMLKKLELHKEFDSINKELSKLQGL